MNRKIITILLICIFLVQGTKSVATENNKGVMSREINGVLYVYSEVDDNSVCIYRILPLYGKPLSNIVIPSRIDEKDVVGLGCQDSFDDEYYMSSVFGVNEDDFYTGPQNKEHYRFVNNHIQTIVLPDSIKEIGPNAFMYFGDGKTINIPNGVVSNLEKLCTIHWKKFVVSPDNPAYMVKNNLLLSKSGEILYGNVGLSKKVKIPSCVKKIKNKAFFQARVNQISISKNVKDIGDYFIGHTSYKVKISLSKNNKYFAMKDGCLYKRKGGELIFGIAKNNKMKISSAVKKIKCPSFSGKFKRIVLPKYLKTLYGYWWSYVGKFTDSTYVDDEHYNEYNYDGKNIFEFTSKKPPKFLHDRRACLGVGITVVPKKSRKFYKKAGIKIGENH